MIELREGMRADALLFGESQSRIVVSVKERDLERLKEIADHEGAPIQVLGEVGGSRLVIQPMVQLPVDEIREIWSGSLASKFQ
jgi:phosphoribosylformylglycinamidine synthase